MTSVSARRPVLLGALFVVLLAAFWLLFQLIPWVRYWFSGRSLPQAQAQQTACWDRPLTPTPVSEGASSDGMGPGAGAGDDD